MTDRELPEEKKWTGRFGRDIEAEPGRDLPPLSHPPNYYPPHLPLPEPQAPTTSSPPGPPDNG